MPLLLCAATDFEIKPTLDWIMSEGLPVRVVITGVGLMATSYALTKAVCASRPQILLQAGIAGSLLPERPLGEVVGIRSESVGDLGVEEEGRFRSLFDMGFLNGQSAPWKDRRLPNPYTAEFPSHLPLVDAVSINEISTQAPRIDYYRDGLKAVAESMEGAAFHYVGLSEGLRFFQLRAFSNYVGDRNKQRWRIADAIEHLNTELRQLIIKNLEP